MDYEWINSEQVDALIFAHNIIEGVVAFIDPKQKKIHLWRNHWFIAMTFPENTPLNDMKAAALNMLRLGVHRNGL